MSAINAPGWTSSRQVILLTFLPSGSDFAGSSTAEIGRLTGPLALDPIEATACDITVGFGALDVAVAFFGAAPAVGLANHELSVLAAAAFGSGLDGISFASDTFGAAFDEEATALAGPAADATGFDDDAEAGLAVVGAESILRFLLLPGEGLKQTKR